jgi:hypothetical protein
MMQWKEKLRYALYALALVLMIVAYVFEFKWFERTVNFGTLALISLLFGLAIGLLWGHSYARQEFELTEKIQVYVYFCVMCMLFSPLVASLSNRLVPLYPVREEVADFVSQEAYYASRVGLLKGEDPVPTGYELRFYYRQKIRTIDRPEPFPIDLERGAPILLRIRTGLWGFEVVQRPAIP